MKFAHKLIISNNLLLLDATWFSCTHNTGVIVCEDIVTHQMSCYIDGTGSGKGTELQDAEVILRLGAHFPLEAGKVLFPHINFDESWVHNNPEYFL